MHTVAPAATGFRSPPPTSLASLEAYFPAVHEEQLVAPEEDEMSPAPHAEQSSMDVE